MTAALIAVNLLVFFAWQPSAFWLPSAAASAAPEFLYHYAAVACEIVSRRPLTIAEIAGQLCLGTQLPAAAVEVFPDKQPLTSVVVSMFLHGGLLHVGGNMLYLWIFGDNIESRLGSGRYLAFYILGGIAAGLSHVGAVYALGGDPRVPCLGASGAISAVLAAYMLLFPDNRVRVLLFRVITEVPAIVAVGMWFLMQVLSAVFDSGGGGGVAGGAGGCGTAMRGIIGGGAAGGAIGGVTYVGRCTTGATGAIGGGAGGAGGMASARRIAASRPGLDSPRGCGGVA